VRFYVYFIALYVHYKISSPVPINPRFVYILYGMYMVPPQEAQVVYHLHGKPIRFEIVLMERNNSN
jgi:hypothetical protein